VRTSRGKTASTWKTGYCRKARLTLGRKPCLHVQPIGDPTTTRVAGTAVPGWGEEGEVLGGDCETCEGRTGPKTTEDQAVQPPHYRGLEVFCVFFDSWVASYLVNGGRVEVFCPIGFVPSFVNRGLWFTRRLLAC